MAAATGRKNDSKPSGKCPQCNTSAKRSDIRVLFARKLVVVDTSERDRLQAQLDQERMARKLAQQNEATALFQKSLLQSRIEALERDLQVRIQREAMERRGDVLNGYFPHFKFSRSLPNQPESTFRAVDFDSHWGVFVAGHTISDSLKGPSHGIVKMSAVMEGSVEYVGGMHEKPIRSLATSPHRDGYILTGSMDGTVKLSSMHNGSSRLLEYRLALPVWSVTFDRATPLTLWAGLSNGTVAEFDIRQTREAVSMTTVAGSRPAPVHSLHPLRLSEAVSHNCKFLLGATINGPFLVQHPLVESTQDSNSLLWPEVSMEGMSINNASIGRSCASLSLDRESMTVFHSYRLPDVPTIHCLDRISGEIPKITPMTRFSGQSGITTALSRSSHLSLDNDTIAMAIGHEASSTMQLYSCNIFSQSEDAPDKGPICGQPRLEATLPTNSSLPVLDVLLCERGSAAESKQNWLVSGLTERSLCLYTSN